MPIKQAGGAKLAYKRFLAAWGSVLRCLRIALGPVLPAVRAAAAGALSPLSSALLKRVRRRLPASTPRWVAPSLAFVGLCALFGVLVLHAHDGAVRACRGGVTDHVLVVSRGGQGA